MRIRTVMISALALSVPAVFGLSAAVASTDVISYSADDAALALHPVGTYSTGQFDVSAAEIVAFHAGTNRTFVVNARSGAVDVLDASDPSEPTLDGTIGAAGIAVDAAGAIPVGAVTNSLAVRSDGLVVLAVEAPVKTDPGWVAFLDAASLEPLGAVQVGSLPDNVVVTPSGDRAVVANEGEPADDFSSDPVGSISVIDLPATVTSATQAAVRTAGFEEFEEGGSRTLDPAVRIFGPQPESDLPVSRNLEPEYIAVAPDGLTAYAALQEANAVATIDLNSATVTDIWPLQPKDHNAPGNGLDPSDRDAGIAIDTWPVKGLQMPDGIIAYESAGQTYVVTINEGDAREWGDYAEAARVKDLGSDGLAPLCESNPAYGLTSDDQLGRLNITTASGLSADQSCYEQLYSFGSRSFSIWTTEEGDLVFDSGDEFERLTAAAIPDYFNSNHSETNFEGRSDDKGPEPENAVLGVVGERTYAFIGLERVGGVVVYDITDAADASFVTYVNRRDFSISVEDEIETAADPEALLESAGDLGPEGLAFVSAEDSPSGEPLVIVGSEVSGTTTFLAVSELLAPVPTPTVPTPTVPTPTVPTSAPVSPDPTLPGAGSVGPVSDPKRPAATGTLPATGAPGLFWLAILATSALGAGANVLWHGRKANSRD